MSEFLLQSLIDKQDVFEIVRDKTAQILVNEGENQKIKARDKGIDEKPYIFKLFTERNNPFEDVIPEENEEQKIDDTPIVNIWFDQSSFTKKDSTFEYQHSATTFNIDCYSIGVSENLLGDGHIPGDEMAAYRVQALARLIRNILMAGQNQYLQMRGLVWGRFISSIQAFQPQLANNNALKVQAIRIILNVEFNEISPQYEEGEIEMINVDLKRNKEGAILSSLSFDYVNEDFPN
jgi:hypothetical protein